ncbi:MAG: hypothetical protein KDK78_10320, partial [Chlamydiia bacterium]|nr:hypothetical protein [Chlamydiia bacterium]
AFQQAINTFNRILMEDLTHPEAHFRLGSIYYILDERPRVEQEIQFLDSIQSPLANGLREMLSD